MVVSLVSGALFTFLSIFLFSAGSLKFRFITRGELREVSHRTENKKIANFFVEKRYLM